MTRPVNTWENERVNGMALSVDRVHAITMKQVEDLRKRHADYEASLPVEPLEIIKAALGTAK